MKKRKIENYDISDDIDGAFSETEESVADHTDGRLSEEELAMLKASIEASGVDRSTLPHHDNSDRAVFLRFLKSNIVLTVASIIVIAAILLSAIGGAIGLGAWAFFYHRDFNIVIGDDEPYKVDYDDAVIDGVLYLDFYRIAKYMNLTISTPHNGMQFTSRADGSYLLFRNESDIAHISGGTTGLYAEAFEGGGGGNVLAYVTANPKTDVYECLVPMFFLQKTIDPSTMTFTYDEKSNTVYVRPRYNVYNGDVENRVRKELLFITDNFNVTLPEKERPVYSYHYSIEISPYLESITAETSTTLMLANKTHSIGRYEPAALTRLDCPVATGRTFELDADAAIAVKAMMLEMAEAGVTDTYVTSAYRDYAYQEMLFNRYVEKHIDEGLSRAEAEAKASTYSARPGESEHQTGLCLDFTTTGMGGNLNEDFEKTDAFAWLKINAHKYGFILRYPKGQEAITGYDYEPWHFRFVGRQAASEMYYMNMTLEEYLSDFRHMT